jgi:hypothetical protein
MKTIFVDDDVNLTKAKRVLEGRRNTLAGEDNGRCRYGL